jgi:GR25 family glycosyltransferase involved in LPS biosynthesis
MPSIDKVYIIHYTKLTERKKHMIQQMNHWFANVEYEFIEDFDQEDLNEKIISQNFDLDAFKNKFDRDFLESEISFCRKYKTARKKAAEDNKENIFILEDDVIFKENPVNYFRFLTALCAHHKVDYDCVFLGEALIRKGDFRNIFIKKDYPSTNGLCTVLYKKKTLEILNEDLKSKIHQPMDWDFNDRFRDLELKVYWGKAITEHGSVLAAASKNYSFFKSSLRESY